MQILVISWSPFFWWRGYLPSNKEYNYEPSTLLETLLIFEGDLRFEDHLNCFSNIFTHTFDDMMDDYNALKEMFEEKLSFVERYGDHNDNLKDFELNAESKQVFAALFSGDVVGHSNKSLKLVDDTLQIYKQYTDDLTMFMFRKENHDLLSYQADITQMVFLANNFFLKNVSK